jgi:hypothetical protein
VDRRLAVPLAQLQPVDADKQPLKQLVIGIMDDRDKVLRLHPR